MTRFEPVAVERHSDLVLVYGDVNSTLAAALVCYFPASRGFAETRLRIGVAITIAASVTAVIAKFI